MSGLFVRLHGEEQTTSAEASTDESSCSSPTCKVRNSHRQTMRPCPSTSRPPLAQLRGLLPPTKESSATIPCADAIRLPEIRTGGPWILTPPTKQSPRIQRVPHFHIQEGGFPLTFRIHSQRVRPPASLSRGIKATARPLLPGG